MSGRWQPLELPDGSYSDDTRPWSQQDVVGYLPTFAEMSGTRSRLKLVTVPGLNPFNVCGTGPHRGARNVEGKLFVVSGQTLFQVFTDGSVQQRGTIPGTGRVSMTHNQVAGGNQLLIGTTSNSYVWDTSDNTLTANGVPLLSVDFLNQLCLGVDSQRRFWRYSGLADATEWNSLDNESAESSPDRIVGGIVSQGEWLVFGERTVEVWLNSPTDATAFQRGPVVEKGCANAATIQRLDNSVIWLGNDNIVYRMQGYTAVPISTKAMAVSLESASQSKAFAFTYEDRGYSIYYLTFQDGATWGYDVTNQRWHRRHSMDLERWRLNTLVHWNNAWYGGDYSNGTLHELAWGRALEGCAYLPRSFSSGVMHGDGNRVRVAAVKMLVDTGGEPSVCAEAIGLIGDAPDADLDDVYSYTYTVIDGTAPYTFSIVAGALPDGISINASTSELTGTFTALGVFTFTVRVVDANGLIAELRDSITLLGSSCGVSEAFAGGDDFPSVNYVDLGTATGEVLLHYLTGQAPDKFVVEFDGADVIETGFVGKAILDYQAQVTARLAAASLPDETIVDGNTEYPDPNISSLSGWRGVERFTKSTASRVATIRVYGGTSNTGWTFSLGCPGSVVDWTPFYLAKAPLLWLNDTSTVTNVSGAASLWADVSGNGWDMAQGTAANRPTINATGLNNRRTLTFDGTNDTLINTSTAARDLFRNKTTGWAMMVVKRTNTVDANHYVFFVPTATSAVETRFNLRAGVAGVPNSPAIVCRRTDGGTAAAAVDPANRGTAWALVLGIVDWANGDLFTYVDGALVASDTATLTNGSTSDTASHTGIAVGATPSPSSWAAVELGELMAGVGIPTATEIDKLFGYAAHRWGLTASLPALHPYKSTAPTL